MTMPAFNLPPMDGAPAPEQRRPVGFFNEARTLLNNPETPINLELSTEKAVNQLMRVFPKRTPGTLSAHHNWVPQEGVRVSVGAWFGSTRKRNPDKLCLRITTLDSSGQGKMSHWLTYNRNRNDGNIIIGKRQLDFAVPAGLEPNQAVLAPIDYQTYHNSSQEVASLLSGVRASYEYHHPAAAVENKGLALVLDMGEAAARRTAVTPEVTTVNVQHSLAAASLL